MPIGCGVAYWLRLESTVSAPSLLMHATIHSTARHSNLSPVQSRTVKFRKVIEILQGLHQCKPGKVILIARQGNSFHHGHKYSRSQTITGRACLQRGSQKAERRLQNAAPETNPEYISFCKSFTQLYGHEIFPMINLNHAETGGPPLSRRPSHV